MRRLNRVTLLGPMREAIPRSAPCRAVWFSPRRPGAGNARMGRGRGHRMGPDRRIRRREDRDRGGRGLEVSPVTFECFRGTTRSGIVGLAR